MTSVAKPVQNLSLAEKVCLPPHLAAYYVSYKKPESNKVENELFYAASETETEDPVKIKYEKVQTLALSYSW